MSGWGSRCLLYVSVSRESSLAADELLVAGVVMCSQICDKCFKQACHQPSAVQWSLPGACQKHSHCTIVCLW